MKPSILPATRSTSLAARSARRVLASMGLVSIAAFSAFSGAEANVIVNGDFTSNLAEWSPLAQGTGEWTNPNYGGVGPAAQFTSPGVVQTNGGTLSQSFTSLTGAIQLTFDANWVYGAPDYGASSLGVMLLDAGGNGYAFTSRNNDDGYGAIWYNVVNYALVNVPNEAGKYNIDTRQNPIAGTDTLVSFSLVRSDAGQWTFSSPGWNGSMVFTDTTVSSFTQLALLAEQGADNSIGVVYDNINLQAIPEPSTLALGVIGLAGIWGLARRRRAQLSA